MLEVGEKQARSEGLRRIAYFCSYVPEEILSVAGLYAYRMRAPSITTTETADSYLGVFNTAGGSDTLTKIPGCRRQGTGTISEATFGECSNSIRPMITARK